ncbi:hypothetical protein [Aureisphaera galaxeae]|uniref:hypothetical protein n=1 Tax=Aureisphaera galaxeae TaxID=1538023 RepID=UPI0023506E9D|nr:hypothetical protein [Aureisphaera galaxeae]
MNKYLWIIALCAVFYACKDTSKTDGEQQTTSEETTTEKTETKLSTAETIAYKSGFEKWKDVNEISFTFNVDRGERHFERSFTWYPKTKKVIYMNSKDTIAFERGTELDSLQTNADQAFINDRYWLLTPFQLVWDEGTTFSEKENQIAPISKDTLSMLTITYGADGGYTPGDAYDLYYGKDFMIKEWVFREGNQEAPSMINTFEDYEDYNGIKIAKTHRDSTGSFKLHFTNIVVK